MNKSSSSQKNKNNLISNNNNQSHPSDLKKIIEVNHLDLFYYKNHVLRDISFNVYEKQVLAFIGPSGCGKSSLLRVFNRMNDTIHKCKTKGLVKINGDNIYKSSYNIVSLRMEVGMIFQKPTPFPMSIYDNVAFGPRHRGIKVKDKLDAIVQDALEKAALWNEVKDSLKVSALSLSGGQQQRLCIARTIAIQPKIILMDEPTSALDPVSTYHIEELVKYLKEFFTIIIVTHHLQQATRLSDYVCFFREGHLIEYGKTKEVFSRPQKQMTLDYITRRIV